MSAKGQLFIVATPIGNLKDITLRALDVLSEVDIILSENTSKSQILLDHYDINTKQLSYREENRGSIIPKVLEMLDGGSDVALISDSGTPLISDPGFKLVEVLIRHDVEIITVPGPSAVTSSISVSGIPSDKFSFVGFLPRSKNRRKEIILRYGNLDSTLVIYESPHRIIKLIDEIGVYLGNRYVCLAKELTKVHEEKIRGNVDDILRQRNSFKQKGEFILLVAKEGYDPR